MNETPEAKVRVLSSGGGRVCIDGLTEDEINLIRAAFSTGAQWVRRSEKGRLEHTPSYAPLPSPAEDVEMHPFWQPATPDRPCQMQMFNGIGDRKNAFHQDTSPSFFIQHLCGYGYTPERYREQAKFLEECGFACMRSPRDPVSGQFWEVWFLPGAWAAEGRLREAIVDCPQKDEKSQARTALRFLQKNASFGTLDIAVQRLAMRIPD